MSESTRAQIRAHAEQHLGPVTRVFNEQGIEVLCVVAQTHRPVHTLITCGMSDAAMDTAGTKDAPAHIELMMTLPESWPVARMSGDDESYWPVRALASAARLPAKGQSLRWGDAIPNGDPPQPYSQSSELCGAILAPSLLVPKEFYVLNTDHRRIEFYAMIPLYREELLLRNDKGMEALLATLVENGVNDLVDIKRRNVTKKRFGFF